MNNRPHNANADGGGGGHRGGGRIVIDGAAIPNISTSLVLSSATNFAKRHKVLTVSYLYGIVALLLLVILGGSGVKLTLDQKIRYDRIMNTIDLQAEYTAATRYHEAYAHYYHAKGWFTCDATCTRYERITQKRKLEWDAIRAEGNARMSDARRVAGLWSEVGVEEVKDSFIRHFHGGKSYAKRRSTWDAMFMGIRSISHGRDESMIEYLLKLLLQVLINFSMGLLMALVTFIWGLWGIIRTYQPNPVTGVVYFVTATCAAFAFVSTYLFMIYGAAAGGVYGMAKLAEANLRLENGGGGGRRNIHGGNLGRSGGMGGGGGGYDNNQQRPHNE